MNHTSFLIDFPYKNVYYVKGFKLVVYENEFAKNFNGIFKMLTYENFNLGKVNNNITSNPQRWNFVFNSKNEVELIYNFYKDEVLLDFLKTKGFKFSKNFKENMGFD